MRCHQCGAGKAFHVLRCPHDHSHHLLWFHRSPCLLQFASLYFRNGLRVRDTLPCSQGCVWPGWVKRRVLGQALRSAVEVHPHFQGLLGGHPWWVACSPMEEMRLQSKRDEQWHKLILLLRRRLPSLGVELMRYEREHPHTMAVIKQKDSF